MGKSIFDHIKNMSIDKVDPSEYTEEDWKSFSPYMIAQWLSMDLSLIEFVNQIQRHTIGQLSNELVYKIYLGFLEKKQYWIKYIKGDKEDKYSPELVDYLSRYWKTSKRIVNTYLPIYFNTNGGTEEIRNVLKEYGVEEKDIKKYISH